MIKIKIAIMTPYALLIFALHYVWEFFHFKLSSIILRVLRNERKRLLDWSVSIHKESP